MKPRQLRRLLRSRGWEVRIHKGHGQARKDGRLVVFAGSPSCPHWYKNVLKEVGK